MNVSLLLALAAAAGASAPSPSAAPAPIAGAHSVGVYDSRAVAYAYFWYPPNRLRRDQLIAAAQAAKASGDSVRLSALTKEIAAESDRSHLEIFSTAPADGAMAALKDRLPRICREAGVHSIVSVWDGEALASVPAADRVDVTDRLVREFFARPSPHLQRTIESIRAAKPLPLWQAKLLLKAGAL